MCPTSVPFGVRWQGFFKATQSETTFSVSIREADERLCLWVDNILLINPSWEYALSAASFSATFGATFVDQGGLKVSYFNSLFDVKLEYVQFAGECGIRAPLFTAANCVLLPRRQEHCYGANDAQALNITNEHRGVSHERVTTRLPRQPHQLGQRASRRRILARCMPRDGI
jgi:hypothetical protein